MPKKQQSDNQERRENLLFFESDAVTLLSRLRIYDMIRLYLILQGRVSLPKVGVLVYVQ